MQSHAETHDLPYKSPPSENTESQPIQTVSSQAVLGTYSEEKNAISSNGIGGPFDSLTEDEKKILNRQLDVPAVKVSYSTLFRYAIGTDKTILAIASLAAIIGGALLPLMTVLFGGLAGSFQSFTLGNVSQNQFTSELARYSLYFVYLAIGEFVVVYIATNIAFFDGLGAGESTTRITAEGGAVVEEVISSIRNSTAFHTQEKLARKYDTFLVKAEKAGYKLKSATRVMLGFIFLFIYLNYGLAFWMGSRFLVEGSITVSQILTIQMSIMIGAFALGNIAPNIQAFTSAVAAASKSTAIALLERFYDPVNGQILIDGADISTLNINAYRSHLALVSQEPNLYGDTIRENILLGTDREDVTEAEIVRCCKEANIYEFITSLPNGLDTAVGNKGCMLSGGQKQRVTIARAMIRRPKILLLDEATSALDSESEKVVQAALDAASQGCTIIAVAHRLSTVRRADVIYVFSQGRIIESGSHEKLMQAKSTYFELVNLQSMSKS